MTYVANFNQPSPGKNPLTDHRSDSSAAELKPGTEVKSKKVDAPRRVAHEKADIEYGDTAEVLAPPTGFFPRLKYLGPGIIVAGSIVGAGELIATTSTGAVAGFSLLWLIIIGCVIKVFVQVELGKHAVLTGKGTMQMLSEMPGPGFKGANWALACWFIMLISGIAALGALLNGVGQAMAIAVPLTQKGRVHNQLQQHQTQFLLISRMAAGIQEPIVDSETPKQYPLAQPLVDLWKTEIQRLCQTVTSISEGGIDVKSDVQSIQSLLDSDTRLFQRSLLRKTGQMIELEIDQLANTNNGDAALLESRKEWVVIIRSQLANLENTANNPKQTDSQSLLALIDKLLAYPSNAAISKSESSSAGRDQVTASPPADSFLWSMAIGLVSLVLLLIGRFRLLELISLVLVGLFTVATIVNIFLLQSTQWQIDGAQIASGLKFQLPVDQGLGKYGPLATALMTFGIIGVGAAELLAYPYWCLEKGYARFTGKPDRSDAWASRAVGWLQILRLDAWLSMFVYTFSTIVFYLLGAAVLHSLRIVPEGSGMIQSLSVMFEPTMGPTGKVIFLCGSVAVLYSTFLVATASHSKTAADAFRVAGWIPNSKNSLTIAYKVLCTLMTFVAIALVYAALDPKSIVLIGGFFQALMLPVLAGTAIYYRYQRQVFDRRLMSSKLWDAFLWISSLGMFFCGGVLLWNQLRSMLS